MKTKVLALAALSLAVTPAFASDLWNQMGGVPSTVPNTILDQNFSDLPDFSTWHVSDVVVGGSGWTVDSISMLVSVSSTAGAALITNAQLNVFANSGALPSAGNDPSTGTSVSVAFTPAVGYVAPPNTTMMMMTASGLNLNLAAGDYWIGLTAMGSFAVNGQVSDAYSGVNSAGANFQSALINPSGADNGTTTWQELGDVADPNLQNAYDAIDIQGTPAATPEPASMAFLGLGIAGLITRRRLRK